MGKEPNISFVDTPEDIRDKYQYFTEANMNKLISIGYSKPFHSLEEGVKDYVTNYLQQDLKIYWFLRTKKAFNWFTFTTIIETWKN